MKYSTPDCARRYHMSSNGIWVVHSWRFVLMSHALLVLGNVTHVSTMGLVYLLKRDLVPLAAFPTLPVIAY